MDATLAVAYVSSASKPFTEVELETLLADARKFNVGVAVTGALLHHDGSFFQYFEGPAAGVDEVYARIRRSRQHHGLMELMHREVERRHFAEWQMGFSAAPRSLILQLEQAKWTQAVSGHLKESQPTLGIGLLLQFWRSALRLA